MAGLPVCPTAHPNDDDLTGVVVHLAPLPTRRGVIERDPNEPEVRWLLEAGIRAMCEGLLDRSSEPTGPVAYSHANGLFDTLPVDHVMRCFRDMCAETGIDAGSANKARLIRRWSLAANYQLDLIAYVFRPALMAHSITEAETAVRDSWETFTLGDLVDEYSSPRSPFSPLDSIQRIQQVLRLMFPGDTAIRRYADILHDLQSQRWGRFYADFSAACGLTLDEHDPADVGAMMHLVAHSGMLGSAGLSRPLLLTDGTSLVHGTLHTLLERVYRMPWNEVAARRPLRRPQLDPDAEDSAVLGSPDLRDSPHREET